MFEGDTPPALLLSAQCRCGIESSAVSCVGNGTSRPRHVSFGMAHRANKACRNAARGVACRNRHSAQQTIHCTHLDPKGRSAFGRVTNEDDLGRAALLRDSCHHNSGARDYSAGELHAVLRRGSQHDLALFIVDLGVEQPASIGGNRDGGPGAGHWRLLQGHQPARRPARELEEIDADRPG